MKSNKSDKQNKTLLANTAKTVIKQGYDASVLQRAAKRAGKNVNLKGHINEIRMVDKFNMNPVNIVKKNKAYLTKSPIAGRDDIIVKNGKNIVKRFQVKDTTSTSGALKTAKQVMSGKYRGTNVVGTKETVEKVMSQKGMDACKQKIMSNGLRTCDNELLAAKALGKGGFRETVKCAKTGTAGAAKSSALFSGAVELVSSIGKVKNKEMSLKQAAYNVGKESSLAALSGAASKVVGDVAAIGTAAVVGSNPVTAAAAAITAGVGSSILADKAGRKLMDKIEAIGETKEEK